MEGGGRGWAGGAGARPLLPQHPAAGAPARDLAANRLRPAPGPQTPAPRLFTLPPRFAVKGRVIDARTRAAIPGALVWFDDELWGASVTDSAGGYAMTGPAGRSLEILAGAPGYLRPDRKSTRLNSSHRL